MPSMSWTEILLCVCVVIFLATAALVGIGLLFNAVRGRRPKLPTIYPVPPSERGTGQHITVLDLMDDHIAAEDRRRRRERLSSKLYDWTQPTDLGAPKA